MNEWTKTALPPGDWFVAKYRAQAIENGVAAAARNLRKLGAPLNVALGILAPHTSQIGRAHV